MMERRKESMDGNTAAAYIAYAFTEVAAIYPITPSSDMAQHVDEWAAEGRKNIFDETVRVMEMQSEGGAAGAVHGSLQAGALTSTYTSAQGLALMIPNMYKIAGELLPAVFHVSSRFMATNGIGIFCDYSDVFATRQTGFALLSSGSVQQVMDLSAVAHLAAIKGSVPFLSFFDGFRTSHEIQKIEMLEYNELAGLTDQEAVNAFRRNALNPSHPVIRGTVQNGDIHFQQREVLNPYWEALPDIVDHYMGEIQKLTGREYHPFNYYGAPDAERIIVAMGSMCQTIEEVVDYLNKRGGKVGLLSVHLYRPFSLDYFFKFLPKTAQIITVLDRDKELGAQAEPLYMDVKTAFYNCDWRPEIIGGRIGVGGKDIRPCHIESVFANMKAHEPKDRFTVGIVDDVTFTSLPDGVNIDTTAIGTKACKFWGMGSDGTVGANKSAVKIIGDNTKKYVQAYFAYDSKKSGGVTVSHLRFGDLPIRSTYLVDKADFISCSQQSYIGKYDLLAGLKSGGTFLLNTSWKPEQLEQNLTAEMKRAIAQNKLRFFTIDAVKIANATGLGGRINMIMQAAFFQLSGVLPVVESIQYLKDSVVAAYGKKGKDIVAMNHAAIDATMENLVEVAVPPTWADTREGYMQPEPRNPTDYVKNFMLPVNRLEGDSIPVSGLLPMKDGSYPSGSAAFEKRGVAITVPHWDSEKCIQCNQCAFVCPHACIRPILTTQEEVAAAPDGYMTMEGKGLGEYSYRIAVSPNDCTGCGNCLKTCPVEALDMRLLAEEQKQAPLWDYAMSLAEKPNPLSKYTVKGSQFEKPFLEFSGACAGCLQPTYVRLITQLFGDRMMIANSAGCAHVWSASVPSNPFTTNDKGQGPAWNSSLFEDTAEFGLGMLLGTQQVQKRVASLIKQVSEMDVDEALASACRDWLVDKEVAEGTQERAERVIEHLQPLQKTNPILAELFEKKDFLVKRSQWIMGGDGWAYDIGYGGLDHVLASGENINVLVMDTEVYSNTGGQASKSTPTGAVAKFAANGKRTRKKDLGQIFMSYGYIYVAQISVGADKAHTLKVLAEAEAFPGPSIVIAYTTCVNHGLRNGMSNSHLVAKHAVDCGYWALYRYNPLLKKSGKNPFVLDSREPSMNFRDFLMNEVRFTSLVNKYPDQAEALLKQTEADAQERLNAYRKLASSPQ